MTNKKEVKHLIYDEDIPASDVLKIVFLPFYLCYKGIQEKVRKCNKSVKEYMYMKQFNDIIGKFLPPHKNPYYEPFYLCWESLDYHYIIHVRPPCRICNDGRDEEYPEIECIISTLFKKKKLNFIITHITKPSDITLQFIENIENTKPNQHWNSDKNHIIILHPLYSDIYNKPLYLDDNPRLLITDVFDIDNSRCQEHWKQYFK